MPHELRYNYIVKHTDKQCKKPLNLFHEVYFQGPMARFMRTIHAQF